MTRTTPIFALVLAIPTSAFAEWCDPPIAPSLTNTDLAREFREEFKAEFDQYFLDASRYTACLDTERTRIFVEMQSTASRYERFLEDSAQWEPTQ